MKRVPGIMFALLAVVTLAWGADNSIGTWKYNRAKSKPAPGSALKNDTMTREPVEGGVKITARGERDDGSKTDSTYTPKFDGKPVTRTGIGITYDTVAVKQVDANTFTDERWLKGGKYHAAAWTVISADGKTMTTYQKGTSGKGQEFSSIAVWDKQ